MTFEELTQKLGIEAHPPLPDGYYPVPQERRGELCTFEMIEHLQRDYNLFAEFYDAVKEGFADLVNDPLRKTYLDSISLYFKDASLDEVLKIKYPVSVNTPASNMLPLLVHLPSIDSVYENYRRRGLTHDEAVACLSIYSIYVREEKEHRSRIVGIAPAISNWMSRFTKDTIIYFGDSGLNFQLSTASEDAPYVLKNRNTGEYALLCANGIAVHKSGIPLGSKGAEDTDGSFLTSFADSDDAYIGHTLDSRYISKNTTAFSKDAWEIVMKSGDGLISTHIFWDSDFTPEKIDRALKRGIEKTKKAYPELDIKALYCCSWLMSPEINDALPSSKLASFSARFMRYPVVSGANLVHHYVFSDNIGRPAEDYDEKTSLQRALKNILINGNHIYEAAGIIPLV